MDKIRLGIIGCGKIAPQYLDNFRTWFPVVVELAACADLNGDAAPRSTGLTREAPPASFARFGPFRSSSISYGISKRSVRLPWLAEETVERDRGHEYAAYIFNAVFGDNTMFKFNGNVRNTGLISNLPEGCCVEVPVLASQRGWNPSMWGRCLIIRPS